MSLDEIQAEIMNWLEDRGYCAWRCNLAVVRSTKDGFIVGGFPHIGAVHRRHNGRLIGIQIERGGPNDGQKVWRRTLTDEGALVIGASSLDDVRKALGGLVVESEQSNPSEAAGDACDEF